MKSLQDRVVRLDNAIHHGRARELSDIRLIVVHATASGRKASGKDVIAYMNRDDHGPISYHYLIDRDGAILRMTDPKLVAFHAGDSAWPNPVKATPKNQKPNGGKSVNSRSLGISFVNDNTGEPLTNLQLESGEWLCRFWLERQGLGPSAVVSHAEVSPGRKTDPKGLFMPAWRRKLAE